MLLLLPPCPTGCSWHLDGALHEPPSFWDPLDTTADFTFGCWSLPASDRSGLKDGCQGSSLETGFWIPVVDQSMPTWTLLLWPSLSVCPFLGSPSSRGQDWLCLFWLVERGGFRTSARLVWHPHSIFWGVISGRGSQSSSFWGVCARCPRQSNVETRVEDSIPAGINLYSCPVAALLCCKCSHIAASTASSTGGGRVNFSKISVAAAVIPLVMLLTRSGLRALWVVLAVLPSWAWPYRFPICWGPYPGPPSP